jgi:hypothetical protein
MFANETNTTSCATLGVTETQRLRTQKTLAHVTKKDRPQRNGLSSQHNRLITKAAYNTERVGSRSADTLRLAVYDLLERKVIQLQLQQSLWFGQTLLNYFL